MKGVSRESAIADVDSVGVVENVHTDRPQIDVQHNFTRDRFMGEENETIVARQHGYSIRSFGVRGSDDSKETGLGSEIPVVANVDAD